MGIIPPSILLAKLGAAWIALKLARGLSLRLTPCRLPTMLAA